MSRPNLTLVRHLVGRFAGSLRPGGPSAGEEAWAASWLGESEQALWRRMSGPDRRHAVGVARQVAVDVADRPVLAAALLHDVGKVESRLGTWGRAAATAAALILGRDRLATGPGRAARYLRHDVLGAALLEEAGSDKLTVAWAREHHLSPDRWTVPADVGAALKAADDD